MTESAPAAVLVVSTYYPPVLGGAETAASQLAEFLAAQGRRVTVITKRTDPAALDREVRNGVNVVRVGPRGPRTAAGKWVFLPALLRELIARRAEYDVVVCVDFRATAIAAQLARGYTSHPVILQAQTEGVISVGRVTAHLHHSTASALIGRAVVWPLQRLYDGGDDYPCISRAIEQETLAVGVPRNRVHYLPNPVDTTRFSPADAATRTALRQAAGIAPDARVAVIVGRLSREKGQLHALRAWQRCAVDRGLLVLVGPDMTGHPWDIGPAARAFVQQQGLADRVRFVGGVPASDVINWLRLADVAVQPSEFEAFGTAAIEAMAAGLPVVASDVGGLRDFVLPGINGFRVPPDQPDALADALSRVMNDDGLRGTLAAGALRTVPEFDVAAVLGRLAMLLDAAVARRRNG